MMTLNLNEERKTLMATTMITPHGGTIAPVIAKKSEGGESLVDEETEKGNIDAMALKCTDDLCGTFACRCEEKENL